MIMWHILLSMMVKLERLQRKVQSAAGFLLNSKLESEDRRR